MEAASGGGARRQRNEATGAAAAAAASLHIHSLPDSVLGLTFEQLGSPYDTGPGVPLACKRWQRTFFSPAASKLWHSLELEQSKEFTLWSTAEQEGWLAARLRGLRTVAPCVQELNVYFDLDILSECLQALSSRPAALQSLLFSSNTDALSPSHLRGLLSFTQLRGLHVDTDAHPLPHNAGWPLHQLPSLVALGASASHFTPECLGQLAALSALTSLSLSSGQPLPDDMPQLKDLSVSFCDLSAGLPAPLAEHASLKVLALNHCGLASIPRLMCTTGLRHLELLGNQLTELPDLGPSTSLVDLWLPHNPGLKLSTGSVEGLAVRYPSLESLSLGSSSCLGPLIRLGCLMPDLAIG
ncbi:hypothetical protein ABPG75_010001 [Micractinium tetrahymenae]